MRLLLLAILISACGQPTTETKAITDGQLTLKLQQVQGTTDGYLLVICRDGACQNALLTYDDQQVLFRDGDQQTADEISLGQLDSARIAIKEGGSSVFDEAVSMTVATVAGATISCLVVTIIVSVATLVAFKRVKKGATSGFCQITRRRANNLDGKKEVFLPFSGALTGGYLYWQRADRSAMLVDRVTANNWSAIFSRDPTIMVKVEKSIKDIVHSLAKAFDLKVNSAALQ